LEAEAAECGLARLAARLAEVDPEGAGRTDLRNPRRVIRALEIHETTGRPQSSYRGLDKDGGLRYNAAFFALSMPREKLNLVIDGRVDRMVAAGFGREVQSLLNQGYSPRLPSLQALGYKQWLLHVGGRASVEEALSLWKRNTRRYARRQMTWFRGEPGVLWLEVRPHLPPAETALRIAATLRAAGGQQAPHQGDKECREAR
jgi:tRNA dimethylallyltransferase